MARRHPASTQLDATLALQHHPYERQDAHYQQLQPPYPHAEEQHAGRQTQAPLRGLRKSGRNKNLFHGGYPSNPQIRGVLNEAHSKYREKQQERESQRHPSISSASSIGLSLDLENPSPLVKNSF